MWLLPFLAIGMMRAQLEVQLGLGPQMTINVTKFSNTTISQNGFGLFGGPVLVYSVTDNVRFGAEILFSWGRYSTEEREEDMVFVNGALRERYTTYKSSHNTTFLKLPLTARYAIDAQNIRFEIGAGLQPFFWLTSTSKYTTTEEIPEINRRETTVRTENNFSGGTTGINRAGIAAVLLAGASFSKFGVYLRYDPMLTSLSQDVRSVQNTLGLMLTYKILE